MRLKTKDEIARMAEGGRLLAGILQELIAIVKVGTTGRELSREADRRIRKAGGTPAFQGYGTPPYPDALCVSVNSCVVHGIPNETPFASGDIVGLDIGMVYRGLCTDMARTIAVGNVSPEARKLIATAREALDHAIGLLRPGATTGDIGAAVQEYVEQRRFGVIRDFAGHGVGHALHEDPSIPNFGKRGTGAELQAGMTIAIEPMIAIGDWQVRIADDGWSVTTRDGSLAAHFEDTIAITDAGSTILTR